MASKCQTIILKFKNITDLGFSPSKNGLAYLRQECEQVRRHVRARVRVVPIRQRVKRPSGALNENKMGNRLYQTLNQRLILFC